MAALKNWARGVLYWNLALDQQHGPHAGGCDSCTGIVTINTSTTEVETAMHRASKRLDDLLASGAHGEAVDAALEVAGGALQRAADLASPSGVVQRSVEYYAFAHFSRFILPGAVRVTSTSAGKGIDTVAFQNAAGGSVVLVAVNGNAEEHRMSVRQGVRRFQYSLPAYSMATFVWQPDAASVPAPVPAPATSSPWLPPIPLPPLPAPEISVAASTAGAPR
ncbi:MAG: glycoside hydrolase family 30 beta sandwich domain-containing protein, partial [Rhodanobacter sp.]